FTTSVVLLAASTSAFSLDIGSLLRRDAYNSTSTAPSGSCPPVWSSISHELTTLFVSGGQCTDLARGAIRAVFHDCFPQGGCDGSLSLPEELARPPNAALIGPVNTLKALANKYGVSVADMIAFAGSHAVVSCPSGPVTTTYVGRKDSGIAAPDGQLPPADAGGDESLQHFEARGFSAQDLAALIGAHTASRQFTTDPSKAGAPQDTTPGVWDVTYFVQTIKKLAPFTFVSDSNLAAQAEVGPVMKQFSGDKFGWDAAFTSAFGRMQLLDTAGAGALIDCTSALPK
ncbi:heme peroxidase, partial [Trichodelitschia bisporula]